MPRLLSVPSLMATIKISHPFTDQMRMSDDSPKSTVVVKNKSVLDILDMLSSLSGVLNDHRVEGNRISISNTIYLIEYKLDLFNFDRTEDHTSAEMDKEPGVFDLSRALGYASQIYQHRAIRKISSSWGNPSRLLIRLKEALKPYQTTPKTCGSSLNLDLLLWTLSIAVQDSFNMSERYIYLEEMGHVCKLLQIRSFKGFEKHLKNVLWMDSFSSGPARQQWNDLDLIQER